MSAAAQGPRVAMLDLDIATWIARLERASGVAEKRYARARLERALSGADPEALAETEAARVIALGIAPEIVDAARRPRPPHAVRVPLVDGDGRAWVRTFEVAYDALEDRAWLGPEAEDACRVAIAAAAARFPARPDARRYRFVPSAAATLEHAWIDGRSLGAACFVSALALFSDRPVTAGAVITGAIEDERVVSVGGVRAKVAAARAIGAETIVVPSADLLEAEGAIGVASLDALADACLAPRATPSDPDALVARAVRAARDGWSGYRWRSVREATTRALAIVPSGRPELRVDALAQLAAASRHLGDLDASVRAIELATETATSSVGRAGVPDEVLARLERQRAMTARSRGALAEADRASRRAVTIARRARLRGELLKGLGVLGLVRMARGDDPGALAPLEEALAITLERSPSEAARSRAYLVEALARVGRMEEARVQAHAALAECETQGERGRAKEAWVRTSMGAALVHAGLWDEARETLDRPVVHEAIARDPLPGLFARRWLGLALARTGELARGGALLTSGVFAYGEALEPSLRFGADVNVLHERAERAQNEALDVESTREAIARVASFEAVRVRLGKALRAAERSLASPSSAHGPLSALASAAGRFA